MCRICQKNADFESIFLFAKRITTGFFMKNTRFHIECSELTSSLSVNSTHTYIANELRSMFHAFRSFHKGCLRQMVNLIQPQKWIRGKISESCKSEIFHIAFHTAPIADINRCGASSTQNYHRLRLSLSLHEKNIHHAMWNGGKWSLKELNSNGECHSERLFPHLDGKTEIQWDPHIM